MASIEISEEKGVRYLHFGSPWVQGAMRIARPWALELEYTRQMMMPLALRDDPHWPESVLQLGLGAASLTRFLYRHRPRARITVIELLPEVAAAARQYFRLPDDPDRVRVHIGEGHDYLAGSERRFDLILVDAFDDKGRSGMIDSVPFYTNCRERLRRHGIASFNFLARSRGAAPAIARIREAFGERVWVLPQTEAGNIVALGGVAPPARSRLDELRKAALRLKQHTGLDLTGTVAKV
jgi:spermidine synthase